MDRKKYNTKQKEKLLYYLIENKDKYLSADDIQKHVKKEKLNIGLTTIYRFLKLLEEQGNLRVNFKDQTKYYQYIMEECSNHYHLKCNNCGKIIHLECEDLEILREHILLEHRFKIDSKFEICGLCEQCYKSKEK